MKFITVADHTGFHEVCLFPETYRNYGHLTIHPVVAVRAKVEPIDNRRGFTLIAESVRRISVTVTTDAAAKAAAAV